MKKVLSIQDISCIGKCSQTVALPIISAMGTEVAILPTALLSAHTAISGFSFKNLTDEIPAILSHWKKEGILFDAIYTGYLGSAGQIDLVCGICDEFKKEGGTVIVDPVMGDNGSFYTGFDEIYAKSMMRLCKKADIILPNITEAALLTGEKYIDNADEAYAAMLKDKLLSAGVKSVVITGVYKENGIGMLFGDAENTDVYFNGRINKRFHGTGDVFASTFVGAAVSGKPIKEAVALAADFTLESIKSTVDEENPYGVNFEKALKYLIERI